MPSKTIEDKVRVIRLEEEEDPNFLKVTLDYSFGNYSFQIPSTDIQMFIPGKEYIGVFEASGMPDFLGDEDKWENICTVSYELKKILNGKRVIWGL